MATTANGIGTHGELIAKGLTSMGLNANQCPTRSQIENSMNGTVIGNYASSQLPRFSDVSVPVIRSITTTQSTNTVEVGGILHANSTDNPIGVFYLVGGGSRPGEIFTTLINSPLSLTTLWLHRNDGSSGVNTRGYTITLTSNGIQRVVGIFNVQNNNFGSSQVSPALQLSPQSMLYITVVVN